MRFGKRSNSQGIAWWVEMGWGWEGESVRQFWLVFALRGCEIYVYTVYIYCKSICALLLTGYWTGRLTMETLESSLGEQVEREDQVSQQAEICMNASAELGLIMAGSVQDDAVSPWV